MDDLRPALSFGFGLLGDGADHHFRKVHVLRLNQLDLDPPGIGMFVQYLLEMGVQFLPLGKEIVKFDLAEHAPQGCLGELGRGIKIVLDLDDGLKRFHDPEVDDGVHFNGYVILGDDILGWDVQRDQPEAYPEDAVDGREDKDQARSLRLGKDPAQAEDNAALVFAEDLDAI